MYEKATQYLEKEGNGKVESVSSLKKANSTLFQCIRPSSLPAHEKNVHRMAQEAFTATTAGGETTARTLALGIFNVLTHQTVFQRLQQEITELMPDASRLPSSKSLEEAYYLVVDISLPIACGWKLLRSLQ